MILFQEYRIDEIEKKLYKLEGEGKQDDERSDEKEKEIQELERVLAEHKDVSVQGVPINCKQKIT